MTHDYCWGPPLGAEEALMVQRFRTIIRRTNDWERKVEQAIVERNLEEFLYACAQLGNEVDEIERLERFAYWETE